MSRPNVEVTCKTVPFKNSLHNFCTPVFDEKIGKNSVKIMRLNMVVTCRQHDTAEFYCSHVYVV